MLTLQELLRMPVSSSRRQFYAHIIATGHVDKVYASDRVNEFGRAWCDECGWSYSPVLLPSEATE